MSGGETESHLLKGLESGGNYNVSIVALSEHLPSAMVGSPIMPGIDRQHCMDSQCYIMLHHYCCVKVFVFCLKFGRGNRDYLA